MFKFLIFNLLCFVLQIVHDFVHDFVHTFVHMENFKNKVGFGNFALSINLWFDSQSGLRYFFGL